MSLCMCMIKNFFFKPIFQHPVKIDTQQQDPALLQRRKDWCDRHLGIFSWMILAEITHIPSGYYWSSSFFYFRNKKDAAVFKLMWYNNSV